MPEAGGTATQSGILYQNTYAALYLGRLCDFRKRPRRDLVVEVRVEAPENVDDIVVTFADHHRIWVQAKENLSTTGPIWAKLWQNFEKQRWNPTFGENDQLHFVTSLPHAKHQDLREAAARAQGATSPQEWLRGLSKTMLEVAEDVRGLLSEARRDDTSLFALFSHLEVEVLALRQMERDEVVRWMPSSNVEPATLFTFLRDSIGGRARYRSVYKVTDLLDELALKHHVRVDEPHDYGITTYMETIRRATARVEIPGTRLSGDVENLFLWPTLRETSARDSSLDDSEEEHWRLHIRPRGLINLKEFPDALFNRAAVIAGAGFGKTALLSAICHQLTRSNRVPAQIPLPGLAESKASVIDYLSHSVNRRFNVNLPWETYCETGRAVVLFDGLDELTPRDRKRVASLVKDFGDRFPDVAWLITVRDHGALPPALDVKVLAIDPLSGDQSARFAYHYREAGCSLAPEALLERMENRPDLNALTRVPLFLALLMATSQEEGDLPDGRSGLLERYLHILFEPHEYKLAVDVSTSAIQLRETAELLAFTALEREKIGLSQREVTQLCRDTPEVERHINDLVARGLLRKSALRLDFSFPIVQEYLAACYLRDYISDEELGRRFELAIKRPWAQTLQFTLEMHKAPDNLVRSLLKKEDDAFYTTSRLVGRCIANGTRVSPEVRALVGDRLAEAWVVLTYPLRKSVGDLMADGFTRPLPVRVGELVSQAWGMYDGTKRIVAACNDPALTRDALKALLEEKFRYNYFLHEMQPAVSKLGDEALKLYVERARQEDVNEEDMSHIALLIAMLDPEQLGPESYRLAAEDTSLSRAVRLAGYMVARGPLPEKGLAIARDLLYKDEEGIYLAHLAVERCADPTSWWGDFIKDNDAPEEVRAQALFHFLDEANDDVKEKSFLRQLAEDGALPRNLRHKVSLLLAYGGATSYLKDINEVLGELDAKNRSLWCSVLFSYRNGEDFVTKGLERLEALSLSAEDKVFTASHLAFDTTHFSKLQSYGGFAFEGRIQHPNIKQVSNLIWKWFERYDGDVRGRLWLLASATRVRHPNAKEILAADLVKLLEADPGSFSRGAGESGSDSEAVSLALSALEDSDAASLLSLKQLKRMAIVASHNPTLGAVRLIARRTTSEVLGVLLEIHEVKKSYSVAELIVEVLENMAGRLGIQLVRRGDQIVRIANEDFTSF